MATSAKVALRKLGSASTAVRAHFPSFPALGKKAPAISLCRYLTKERNHMLGFRRESTNLVLGFSSKAAIAQRRSYMNFVTLKPSNLASLSVVLSLKSSRRHRVISCQSSGSVPYMFTRDTKPKFCQRVDVPVFGKPPRIKSNLAPSVGVTMLASPGFSEPLPSIKLISVMCIGPPAPSRVISSLFRSPVKGSGFQPLKRNCAAAL
mmetsp:Transcript_54619/g.124390  ORF Transcript_54619/g.124390 Transcript_54619/m.124390 type:complete len:206 (+) Transcript_54619:553-1170(+)